MATESTVPPPEAVYDLPRRERLAHMAADARLLLNFVVSSATAPADAFVSELMNAINSLEGQLAAHASNEETLEMEKKFLLLYSKLSSLAAPVSAQSIRHTLLANKSRAPGSTTGVAIVALLVFFAVVMSQGYWVVGKRFRDNIQRQDLKKQELLVKENTILDNLWHVEQRAKQFSPLDCDDTLPSFVKTPRDKERERDSLEEAKRCTLKTSLDDEQLRLQLNLRPIQRESRDVTDQTEPVMNVVTTWYKLSSAFSGGKGWENHFKEEIDREETTAKTKRQAIDDKAQEDQKKSDAAVKTASKDASSTSDYTNKMRNELIARRADSLKTSVEAAKVARIQTINQQRSRVLIHRADINLDLLQSYLIPALLGLLGALIFILRDTSVRLKNYAYVPDSWTRGLGRAVVGTMAGVLGGWFVPNVDSVAKAVPPLVIPFVFGYSVELLFGLLDKAVGVFNSPSSTPKQPPVSV